MNEINYEDIITYDTPAYKQRKRRWGDRREGRRLKNIPPMMHVVPYIMRNRIGSQNCFEDVIDITNIERYLDAKHKEGYPDMTLLHVILSAYVRIIAEKPGINRFIAGRRVFARNNVECVMTIKKEMTLDSPDTCIKAIFDPRDNIYNVYKKFRKVVKEALAETTGFDDTANVLKKFPRFVMRAAMAVLRWLDYHGKLPKALLNVSPFHGSMIITSMGSLGIPAIYHHLYDFGTLPIFISYGNIFTADAVKRDGTRERHHFVTFKVVTDERICDGYYYASVFKRLKKILQNPEILDQTLESVVEDVD
jgi:hypothetical protein